MPNYQTTAQLTITDKGAFTDFATFILHNPSFTWVVHSDNIEVIALATNFQNVGIAKVRDRFDRTPTDARRSSASSRSTACRA